MSSVDDGIRAKDCIIVEDGVITDATLLETFEVFGNLEGRQLAVMKC